MVFMVLGFLGCGEEEQSYSFGGKKELVDASINYGDSDADVIFDTPMLTIPPYTEKQHCYFLTYDGPDVAVVAGSGTQNPDFGHHVLPALSKVSEADYPDGTLVDCTEQWVDAEPMIEVTELAGDGTFSFALPEGLGRRLKSGQRIMVNSHHINTTDAPIQVNDRIELYVESTDTIDTFVAPFWHSPPNLYIPTGSQDISHTCTIRQDLKFLYIMGHMHENGVKFTVDHHRLDGTTERIYEVEQWDAVYRDVPPVNYFDDMEFEIKEGESITTTCSYQNDTDGPLSFPAEMCTTIGIVYPAEEAFECYE